MRFFTRPILGCSPRPRNRPGLDSVVAHLLSAAVDRSPAVLLLGSLTLRLHPLLLLVGNVLLLLPLLEVPHIHFREVALAEILDVLVRPIAEHLLKSLHEVLHEDILLGIIRVFHHREERRHLLLVRQKVDVFAVVHEWHAVRLVWGRENHAVVLQRRPQLLRALLRLPGLVRVTVLLGGGL